MGGVSQTASQYVAMLQQSPNRYPDWVWRRAQLFVAKQDFGPSIRRDGAAGAQKIRRTAEFLRAWQTAQTSPLRLCELEAEYSALFWAYQLYHGGAYPRVLLESRILARQSDEDIAGLSAATPETIRAYADIFFDVRDRLENVDYIVNHVLGEQVHGQLGGQDQLLLWKMFGYFLGPHVLQMLVTKFHNPTFCQTRDGALGAITDDTLATFKVKAALAAKTIGVNEETQLRLMKMFSESLRIEATVREAQAGSNQLMDAIRDVFTSLPVMVGGKAVADGRVDANAQARYDRAGVVLAGPESLAVAMIGRVDDTHVDEILDASFEVLTQDGSPKNEQSNKPS